eukprot:GHVP01012178.1.p1 GENE.GHVP01012178.1~~GHVP01012178.1.p1  ORF type:complete len:116 (+),score=16.73 GHVP01012178.1:542-889(+)
MCIVKPYFDYHTKIIFGKTLKFIESHLQDKPDKTICAQKRTKNFNHVVSSLEEEAVKQVTKLAETLTTINLADATIISLGIDIENEIRSFRATEKKHYLFWDRKLVNIVRKQPEI